MSGLPSEVERILAPNPGPLTGQGTNTWLFGRGEVVVIDPGPLDPQHLEAVARAASLRGGAAMVVCTHHHPDHREGAERLTEMLGTPLALFHRRAERAGELALEDGDRLLAGDGWLEVVHTPGHSRDHLCLFAPRERVLFSGDHILSGTTSVIWPPEGDMADYLASLARVRELDADWLLPGHGEPISEPRKAVEELIAHRLERERQVLEAIGPEPRAPAQLVGGLYRGYPREVLEFAAQTVLAHCLKLELEGRIERVPGDGEARFRKP
ncbi:MAG: MBL fold metallo-hydrolase [Candidatus Dormibacteraeota bacterium]|nr:MBL fold metallo-hydrolase [Candidatus Dormibacteraeota bacterium]